MFVFVNVVVCIVYMSCSFCISLCVFFFFQAEDGIRDLVRSRGLGDVYKRQPVCANAPNGGQVHSHHWSSPSHSGDDDDGRLLQPVSYTHLTLPTSDLV